MTAAADPKKTARVLNRVGKSGATLLVDNDENLRILPDWAIVPPAWTTIPANLLWNLARHAFGTETAQAFAAGTLTDPQAEALADFLRWAARYSTAEAARGVHNEHR